MTEETKGTNYSIQDTGKDLSYTVENSTDRFQIALLYSNDREREIALNGIARGIATIESLGITNGDDYDAFFASGEVNDRIKEKYGEEFFNRYHEAVHALPELIAKFVINAV